jgi:sRNA-binding regulator protein Hfq
MRKPILSSLITALIITSTALADTIHLKNGSVLKGKVTSFADDQFIVMLDTGSGRYLSKAMVYIGDVSRIDFDSQNSAADSMPNALQTNDASSRSGGNTSSTQQRNNKVVESQPREVGPPTDTQPTPVAKEPEAAPPEKPNVPPQTSDISDSDRLSRKPGGPVKTITVDVVGKRDWTSTGLIVKRGDRIRITASGSVTLDPSSGRASGPEGLAELADPKKLMPDQPTGALIGVIGADNDDFIFIGRSSEFQASRDGLLFLSVNEGNLADNTGTYKAVIEVQAQRKQ